jgi:ATP synthase protein I
MLKNNLGNYRVLGEASMAGLMLAACIFVGTALGIGLDRWLGTKPVFTLTFMIMGIIAGFYNVYRILIAISSRKNQS